MVKRTPAPPPLPSIVIVPPWSATTSRAMASPSPVPRRRAARASSRRVKRSKIRSRWSRRDARTVVGDAEHRGGRRSRAARPRPSTSAWRAALSSRLRTDPHELIGVAVELRARHLRGVDPVRGAAAASRRASVRTISSRSTGSRWAASSADASAAARVRRSSTSRCRRTVSSRTSRSVACQSALLGVREVDLELGADAGQRAAQLVAGVGDEPALAVGGVLEPGEHRVHRLREPADLVVGRRARARGGAGPRRRSPPPRAGSPRPVAARGRSPPR